MIIYLITNSVNDKVYVGQTTGSLKERWGQHKHRSPSQQATRSAIHNAIKLYGVDNFKIIPIDETATTIDELNALEIKYIAEYDCLSPKGYNLLKGGDNKECHVETKAKISTTLKGRPIKNRQNGAAKGRPVSTARRAQISATMTGVAQPWKYKAVVASNGVVYESVQAAAKALGVNRVTISGLVKSGRVGRLGLSFKFKAKSC